jgi:putative hydrolase of the HAD superfamily
LRPILVAVLRAVVFDVDFTLCRPGPELSALGYRELGLRYGLDLDPALYDEARAAAITAVKKHPELDHDEEIWIVFTEQIIRGMGGTGDTYAAAVEMESRWVESAHFELYEDAAPTVRALRGRGLKIGLLSNSSRDLAHFVDHHRLEADAFLTSRAHGKTKPHESIFRAVLGLLDVDPCDAAMVGDTLHEDIEGALSVGMGAVLIDRAGRYPEIENRLTDLAGLAAALGLE